MNHYRFLFFVFTALIIERLFQAVFSLPLVLVPQVIIFYLVFYAESRSQWPWFLFAVLIYDIADQGYWGPGLFSFLAVVSIIYFLSGISYLGAKNVSASRSPKIEIFKIVIFSVMLFIIQQFFIFVFARLSTFGVHGFWHSFVTLGSITKIIGQGILVLSFFGLVNYFSRKPRTNLQASEIHA